jgi:hypothetical protein
MATPRERIAVAMGERSSDNRFYATHLGGDKFAILAGGAGGAMDAGGVLVDAYGAALGGDAQIVAAGGGALVSSTGQAMAAAAAAIATGGGVLSDTGSIIYLQDDFSSYSTISQALAGQWDSAETQNGATHSIATVLGPDGVTNVKAYQPIWTGNEHHARLCYRFPGSVDGDVTTGKTRINVRWRERVFGSSSSTPFDFIGCFAKGLRIIGRQASGNVTLDDFLAYGDFQSPGTFSLGMTGQGWGNDIDFCLNAMPMPWGPTTWKTIEVEGKLNTVGQADGYWKIYVDGNLIGQRLNVCIRGRPGRTSDKPPFVGQDEINHNWTWHEVHFGGWDSGTDYPNTRVRNITDVVIANQYIGV